MEFDYVQFALYILGALSIPAVMVWGTFRLGRRSRAESRRQAEERMGGPYIHS
jgi:hypothetical protein